MVRMSRLGVYLVKEKSNSIRFLEIYDKLDEFMRANLSANLPKNQDDAHSQLIRKLAKTNSVIGEYEYDLLSFARLRNSIVHNPNKKSYDPIAEPHDKVLGQYEEIYYEVTQPDWALDIGTKKEDMLIAYLNDNLLDTMRAMNNRGISSVPVLDDGRFVGVFSENTVFRKLASQDDSLVNHAMSLRDIEEYIYLENHSVDKYIFLARATSAYEAEDAFEHAIQGDKRLMAIFITEHGKPSEYILGMLTAWDVVGLD